jgi:hypothetical protein
VTAAKKIRFMVGGGLHFWAAPDGTRYLGGGPHEASGKESVQAVEDAAAAQIGVTILTEKEG